MAKPPVAKLMDYGKFKYEAAMKAREARKNQVNTVIKEIKPGPRSTSTTTAPRRPCRAVLEGRGQGQGDDHVPRSRAVATRAGFRLLQKLAEDVVELGSSSRRPSSTDATWSW